MELNKGCELIPYVSLHLKVSVFNFIKDKIALHLPKTNILIKLF